MRDFKRGETVELYAEVKDQAGAFVDPATSITITVVDSAGTSKVSVSAMTKTDTGKYSYYYTIASDAALGWWTSTVITTDTGSKITIASCGFEVTV